MTVMRTDPAGLRCDRGDVVNVGGFEQHVRDAHDRGPLVDRLDQPLGVDRDAILRGNDVDLGRVSGAAGRSGRGSRGSASRR